MVSGRNGVEVVERHPELLAPHESLYRKRTRVVGVEEKDLSYFDLIGEQRCRKTAVGLFGFGGAGKTSLVRLLGSCSAIKGSGPPLPTETPYEAERGGTIHVHPSTVLLSRKSGASAIMTLLDTPGHMDMVPAILGMVDKIDIGVVIFDIRDDLSLQHEIVLDAIRLYNKPVVVVVNKLDLVGKGLEDVVARKVDHLKSVTGERVCLEGWFIGSIREGRIGRMSDPMAGVGLENIKGFDDLVEELCVWSKQRSHGNKSGGMVGFLGVGDSVLCSLVLVEDVSTESFVEVLGERLAVEGLYLPFPGCLVETKSCRAGIGVLARLKEDLLPNIVIPSNHRVLASIVREALRRRDVLDTGALGIDQGVIRVRISPTDPEEFESDAWKLRLLFNGLEVDGCCLSGSGELLMDAALYSLRNSLGIKFDVLSVSSNLKEVFKGSFEESVMVGEEPLILKGGPDMDGDEKHKLQQGAGKKVMMAGPLIGEPLVSSYLEMSSITRQMVGEDLRRVRGKLAKHTAILEPWYLVEIIYAEEAEEVVAEMIRSSHGEVAYRSLPPLSELRSMLCYVPVAESFGFETDLRIYSCSGADCVKLPLCWRPVADEDRARRLARFVGQAKGLRPAESFLSSMFY